MLQRFVLCLTPIAFLGCASEQGPEPAAAGGVKQAPEFDLVGSRIIGCCCVAPCPCRINKKPTHCHGCDHTDAVHIDNGFVGATRMDGLTWVICGRGFGENSEENWVVVYLDDKATPEQQKALEGMLDHDIKAWGEKAKYLAGAFKGIKRAPVTYTVSGDKRSYSCVIPGTLELKTRAIVNPGHTEPIVSTGILDAFGDRFIHADAVAHVYKDEALGYTYALTGRQANWADFHLTPARVAQGGIGWGCWTAHADFNDKAPYQEQSIGHH